MLVLPPCGTIATPCSAQSFTAIATSCVLAGRSTAEWTAALTDEDIPFAPVNSIDDLLSDPHLEAIGFWRRFEHPTEGALVQAGIPISFSETPVSVRRHAPSLGEHTDEVFQEVGLSMEEIAAVLSISLRSAKRDWSLARLWLFQELHPEHS